MGKSTRLGDEPMPALRRREADAERFAAVIEALTGVKPQAHHVKNGKMMIECG